MTGSPGTATLTQSIDVCAGSTYSFSFYSGVPENVGTTTNGACTIDASIGGQSVQSASRGLEPIYRLNTGRADFHPSLARPFEGTPRYTVKPCSSLQPCNLESNVGANSYEYRIDTATYTATTSGSVQVTFQYTCARDSTETTLLDQVSVKQVAWAFRCSKGQTITVWVANHLGTSGRMRLVSYCVGFSFISSPGRYRRRSLCTVTLLSTERRVVSPGLAPFWR